MRHEQSRVVAYSSSSIPKTPRDARQLRLLLGHVRAHPLVALHQQGGLADQIFQFAFIHEGVSGGSTAHGRGCVFLLCRLLGGLLLAVRARLVLGIYLGLGLLVQCLASIEHGHLLVEDLEAVGSALSISFKRFPNGDWVWKVGFSLIGPPSEPGALRCSAGLNIGAACLAAIWRCP